MAIVAQSPLSFSNSSGSSDVADDLQCIKNLSAYVATLKRCQVSSTDDTDFNAALRAATEAIKAGVYPQRIPDGSSGSYFVLNVQNEIIAVFKPRDEESFASLNPKWPKFFQRILCFCCFGRACLIPNSGYLSETGASLVDTRLQFFIVPKTRVVKLCSPSFYYGQCCGRQVELRSKQGSFQLYVNGYQSATEVMAEWNDIGASNVLIPQEIQEFTVLFQKMCILDYLIRNTDRHMDNWLIRHVPQKELKIAAIDNGLAFPIKHPESASRFSHFPFDWSTLSWASKRWDDQLRDFLLNLITPQFVDQLCRDLMQLFRVDKTHSRLLYHCQIRVIRGQFSNLHESLLARESPCALAKRAPVIVSRHERVPQTSGTLIKPISPKTPKIASKRSTSKRCITSKGPVSPTVFLLPPPPLQNNTPRQQQSPQFFALSQPHRQSPPSPPAPSPGTAAYFNLGYYENWRTSSASKNTYENVRNAVEISLPSPCPSSIKRFFSANSVAGHSLSFSGSIE